MTGGMVVLSAIGAVVAIVIRMVFMTKLHKSLLRAASSMQTAGQTLRKRALQPMTLACIAQETSGSPESEICKEYNTLFKKPVNLCAKLFGIDSITKDFVKYFDSKLSGKTKKSGGKKKKKSSNSTKKSAKLSKSKKKGKKGKKSKK
uniref:Secreted protein n=1 Tax=Caenorhabditis tropicalis TaxID=1561998 RepID=A0A1I7UGP1_9PELO